MGPQRRYSGPRAGHIAMVNTVVYWCIGAEPIPYIGRDAVKHALLDGPKLSRDVFVNEETIKTSMPSSSVELLTLPVCLQFARTLGARSLVGRRMIVAEKTRDDSRRSRTCSASDVAAALPTTSAAAVAADNVDNDGDGVDKLRDAGRPRKSALRFRPRHDSSYI